MPITLSGPDVQGTINQLDFKTSCRAATDASLVVSAAGSGAGKTLTATANGAITVDTIGLALNERVLVKDQGTGSDNGVYTVTQVGDAGTPFILTRATDFDSDENVTAGAAVFISEGAANGNINFQLTTDDPITVDTTALVFTSFGAGAPSPHALGGVDHGADTLANLNTKVSDATLDDSSASRPPSGAASGDLGGTYPSPTVNDGADSTAIHDDTASEISAVAVKATPVSGDLLLIEDSAAGNAKKSITVGSLPAGAPAAHAATHENGGLDEINVAGLSGLLADDQNPVNHAADHQHGGGDEVATATAGANAIPKAGAGGTLDAAWIPDGGDATAIHDDAAGEIAAVTAKTPLVGADTFLIEDSAATNAKKSATIADIRITESQITDLDHTDADAIHDNVAGEIAALTLVSAAAGDHILIEDADDSNNKKRVAASDFLSVGGDNISVNGTAASDADFDDATPAAPAGDLNVLWQKDTGAPDNISAYVDVSALEPLVDHDNLSGFVANEHLDWTADQGINNINDANIVASSVTQHEGSIDHDALLNFAIGEHRVINDAGTSTTELWSASKIDSEISAVVAGVDIKAGVDTTTTGLGNIALSGEQTLNGLLTSASRVLVTEQSVGADNGIYITAAGAWSRATDADENAEVTNGNIVHVVNSGSSKYKFKYLLVTADPITVGSTAQTWEEHRDIDFGTTAGTATEGNDTRVPSQDENDALLGTDGTPSTSNRYVTDSDPRNTDARTPTAHATSHQHGGSDEVATATPAANAIPKAGAGGTLDAGWVPDGGDATAIHDDTAGEIAALTLVTAASGDHILIEDATDSNNKKRVDAADFLSGGGDSISVNGAAATDADFDDATPAAPAGDLNIKWQKDALTPNNISGYVDVSVLEPLVSHDALSDFVANEHIDWTADQGATDIHANNIPDGADATAIHDNVASEISAITAKATPVAGDFLIIEDSAAANVKKSITMGDIDHDALTNFVANEHIDWTAASAGTVDASNIPDGADGSAIHDDTAGEIAAVAAKTPLVAGDLFLIEDSAAANAKKSATVADIRITESQITDLTHLALTGSAPADVTKAAAAVGVATTAARADHKHDVTTAAAVANPPGTANAEGAATSLARSDHTHLLAPFGTGAGEFCEGNDSRLSDDRTASGLRTASTVVAVSAATAPSSGQVLTATSGTAANWQTPAASAPTKDMWYPAPTRSQAKGDHIGQNISVNGSGRLEFRVPHDFTSITDLSVIVIPNATVGTADIDLNSDYGAVGENFANHSESDTTITFSLTADVIAALDISSVFTSLAALDNCGIMLSNNSVTSGYTALGIRLRYS